MLEFESESAQIQAELDPRHFYDDRLKQNIANSGVFRYAYELFGFDNMRSLAFALNPYSKFAVSNVRITVPNRSRKQVLPYTDRQIWRTATTVTTGNTANPLVPNPPPYRSEVSSLTITNIGDQLSLEGFSLDSTRRTRDIGSEFGEFEFFRILDMPKPRYNRWKQAENRTYVEGTNFLQYTFQDSYRQIQVTPSGGRLVPSSVNTLKTNESSYALSTLVDNAPALLSKALPSSRSFDLFREVAELRDLPSTLKGITESLLRRSKSSLISEFGSLVLAKEFGIDPVLDSLRRLIHMPERISKRVNYLLSRQHKATTFRSFRSGVSEIVSPPPFTIDGSSDELGLTQSTKGMREWELRCMLSAYVQFPQVDPPKVRDELLHHLYGANPSLVDLYNLIPWTWLIDWFAGLDDYVRIVEQINEDPSLINYGFITYRSIGTLLGRRKFRTVTNYRNTYNGVVTSRNVYNYTNYECRFRYKYLLRKNIAELASVSAVSNPDSLNSFQSAIIGALLLQRSG